MKVNVVAYVAIGISCLAMILSLPRCEMPTHAQHCALWVSNHDRYTKCLATERCYPSSTDYEDEWKYDQMCEESKP